MNAEELAAPREGLTRPRCSVPRHSGRDPRPIWYPNSCGVQRSRHGKKGQEPGARTERSHRDRPRASVATPSVTRTQRLDP
jgi:hypothetical protein